MLKKVIPMISMLKKVMLRIGMQTDSMLKKVMPGISMQMNATPKHPTVTMPVQRRIIRGPVMTMPTAVTKNGREPVVIRMTAMKKRVMTIAEIRMTAMLKTVTAATDMKKLKVPLSLKTGQMNWL